MKQSKTSGLKPAVQHGGLHANRRSGSAFGDPVPEAVLRRAYTLVEMLVTVAILVILLGLMVSLAHYVREQSARELTRELLTQLDRLTAQYVNHNSQLPGVTPLLANDAAMPSSESLADASRINNEQCIAQLRADFRTHQTELTPSGDPFEKWPLSVYDRQTLRDAWGSPLVFMPGQHPLIGLAPSRGGADQFFFFSAGPDRKYLTRDDNVYSYESGETH